MKTSKKYSINWHDALKGFITASLTSLLFFVQESLDQGDFVFDWKKLAMSFVGGGIGYLIKQFFTDAPKAEDGGCKDGTCTVND